MHVHVCVYSSQMSGQSAPAPTRGPNVGGDDDGGEEEVGGASAPVSLADLMPKVLGHDIIVNHAQKLTFFTCAC